MTNVEQIGSVQDALRSVAARYAIGADLRDVPTFLSAFHPDAVLEVYRDSGSPEASRVMHGHEEIGLVPGRLRRHVRTHHMIGQQEFVVGTSTATGCVYCSARHLHIAEDGRRADLAMFIRYLDEYAPAEAGLWRLTRRRVMIDWTETVPAD